MATSEGTAVVIVAAGRGTRMGGAVPKQWLALAGRPVVCHALDAFAAVPGIARTVLVHHPDDADRVAGLAGGFEAVPGGVDRAASVRAGLEALAGHGLGRVLIHDGARPFPSVPLVGRLLAALDDTPGAAPALAMTDALWKGEAGRVSATRPREGLWRAQTPQAFRFDAILAAHRAHGGGAADDVAVALAAGLDVAIVPGEEDNIKLTVPADLARAAAILAGRHGMDIRVGNGFDVHGFTAGDRVWLCGVPVPHTQALLGHSDADVGMHALTDAIYGALAEGDIGRHFPPSDPQWKGAESRVFLAHAAGRIGARGYRLANADVTLVCEAPKIGPHAGAMRAALAAILGVGVEAVSVKATTSERLGFTGRGEGIAALATATLVRA